MSNEKKIRSFNRSRDKEDIVKDKNFRALKPGKRISEEGNVYYENRPNRSDIAPRQKLAEGGVINEKKIASIEAEIAEYEMLLDDSSVPADEKKFAKSEIADLKEKIKSLNKKKAKSFKKSDKKLKHFKVIKSTKRGKSKAKSFKTTAKKIRSFNRCRDKSDIAKDKNIRALKPGKRISKRGWKNQYGTSKGGKTYYENRPNRSDIAPRQKLAEGGVINEITAKDAIIQYGINNLSEGVGVNKYGLDLHNEIYKSDYFIVGSYKAEQFLNKVGVFNAIDIIKEYEEDNFGGVNTDFSEPESVLNMYAYIIGEEVLNNSKTLQDAWDRHLTEEDIKNIIEELKNQLSTKK